MIITKSKIKKFLIILNIILLILLILQLTDNTLYLKDVKKEITNILGKNYTITIHKMSEGHFVILATIPEDLYIEEDYDEKMNQFNDSLGKYKIKPDKVNKIVLNVGYHTQDAKYIKNTTNIELVSIDISN